MRREGDRKQKGGGNVLRLQEGRRRMRRREIQINRPQEDKMVI